MHRIAVDAMGGDGAPRVIVEGALSAIREWPERLRVVLVGQPVALAAELPDELPAGLEIVQATEVVGMHESPVRAVRRKRDSSIVVGLGLQAAGEADAFVSAGSTGAVMAASRFLLGMLPGVARPTIGTLFPTAASPTLVVDSGANIETRPSHLLQFAHLGAIYMRDVMGLEEPRVGLLNVGEEAGKGDDRSVAAHRLLREDGLLNFVGNVEGHQIITGACDVLVCDGFVGNVLLKFYESVAGFVHQLLDRTLEPTGGGSVPEELRRALDYTERGGAPLLGIDGVSIICHGSSPANAIKNAIRVAAECVESGMIEDMAAEFEPTSRRARVWRRIRRR